MTASSNALVVLCTCPDEAAAAEIATALIAGGLAACVNRIPGIRSVYRWEGQIREDAEVLLVIKTSAARYAELEAAIRQWHPYEVPELLALPVATGASPYLEWIEQSTRA